MKIWRWICLLAIFAAIGFAGSLEMAGTDAEFFQSALRPLVSIGVAYYAAYRGGLML